MLPLYFPALNLPQLAPPGHLPTRPPWSLQRLESLCKQPAFQGTLALTLLPAGGVPWPLIFCFLSVRKDPSPFYGGSERSGGQWVALSQRSALQGQGENRSALNTPAAPPCLMELCGLWFCRGSPGMMINWCLGCVRGGLIKKVAGRWISGNTDWKPVKLLICLMGSR